MKKTLHALLILCLLVVSTANAQYTKLLDFAGISNGEYPYGSLISDGTSLYGMTSSGGGGNQGAIFKINPDGTAYTILLDFDGPNTGNGPNGSLISDGTALYGMTASGGTNGFGTIFKINPDGTAYVKLLDFDGANSGSYPFGSLISDGTTLYGMTHSGGTNNNGTIFKINTDGTGFVKLLDFDGINGEATLGSLISDGTALYGMTRYGGGNGNIFKINTDGTGYTTLHDFNGTNNGAVPHGSLISDGTVLYGTTRYGGISNKGIIFKINTDGTAFTKLMDFNGASNGSLPMGSLVSDGTILYGMTSEGGTNNLGTIFSINSDGTGYTKLLDFDGSSNGSSPKCSLISDGTTLYGMTYDGGSANLGTVFKYCLPSTSADAPSSVSVCDSYTLPSLTIGDYYTGTGGTGTMLNAGDTVTSTQSLYVYTTNGSCSDENSFDVMINTTPISTVTQSGISLTSDQNGLNYQWLDCDNNYAVIPNETNQSFTPANNGSYAVELTENSCVDTSDCSNITGVGIIENTFNSQIIVYPNPTNGQISLVSENEFGYTQLIMRNVMGQEVFRKNYSSTNHIDLNLEGPAGVYFIEIVNEDGEKRALLKVIKE